MKTIQVTSKDQLNSFVGSQKNSQFLQSWQWGEFHEKVSGDVWRFGVIATNSEPSSLGSEKLVAAATVIKKRLPMGKSYFYCPRGPIRQSAEKELSFRNALFEEIERIAKKEGVMFIRFDPTFKISDYRLPRPGTGGLIIFKIVQTLDVQPSKTLILDLTKSEEELLKNMHQKTRYNIRLAEKKSVRIFEADINYFDSFWKLLGETTNRDKFRSHGQDYYTKMLKVDPNFIKLFVAEYKGMVIAANIVSFFGDTVTYMHGASGSKHRNVMAPYLLQWHVINLAKDKGYKYYDLYGVDEKKWPGVTRFKKGFNSKEISYPGTFDLVFDEGWYSVYKMVRRVRRTF